MAILAECPWCHKKQSIRNRMCSCGKDLMAAKRAKKVRYWVSYRLPGGKQRREPAGSHRGQEPQVYFWRTASGAEVDIVVAEGQRLIPLEVKLSATPRPPWHATSRPFGKT